MTTASVLQDTLSSLYAEQERLTADLRKVNDELESGKKSAGLAERGEGLVHGLSHIEAKIAETRDEWQAAVLGGLDAGTGGREAGSEPGASQRPSRSSGLQSDAKRVIAAAHKRAEGVDDSAFAKAEALVSVGPAPARNLAARWAIATGDPDYETAFCKLLVDPTRGHLTWTPREARAYQRVAEVQAEQKAMTISPDSAGGFMVPFTLDPSVILTSAGSVNPLRQISRTVTTITDQWAGVTSTGVTAEWLAESAQAADATPV
ncbi:MAG TPA: phage major capsid protein, partial [Acidimicrobiales bacterium]|nr:phage major capsid protein [Acidimicrobiales bacterium]